MYATADRPEAAAAAASAVRTAAQQLWSPQIGSRGISLEKVSHRNIVIHHAKQGCFGRLTVRATCCTRNMFKKPCAIGEIAIFTCFGPVLYEGSMEGF